VKAVATNLSWLGYPEAETAADTGRWDGGVETGLRNYQRERGVTVDGWAAPGGETERALNGDLPRANWARDEDSFASARSFERRLDGILDNGPASRASPVAAARAFFARAGAQDRIGMPSPARDSIEEPLGDSTVTGEPLKLKPLPQSPAGEASAPAVPTLDEVEDILTNGGYRYRPDPMGRLGKGDWTDSDGNVLSPSEKTRILEKAQLGQSAPPEPAERGPFADEREANRPSVTIEIDDDEEETETSADEDGRLEPANLLDRILQDLFGRKSKNAWQRDGKLSPKAKERVGQIKNERTRRAVEALLDGSDDETDNNRHAISAYKRSGKHGAHFDFGRLMARLGKSWRDANHIKDETGRIIGRKYVTEEGVEVVLNFSRPEEPREGNQRRSADPQAARQRVSPHQSSVP
jgi:hypothetical protein